MDIVKIVESRKKRILIGLLFSFIWEPFYTIVFGLIILSKKYKIAQTLFQNDYGDDAQIALMYKFKDIVKVDPLLLYVRLEKLLIILSALFTIFKHDIAGIYVFHSLNMNLFNWFFGLNGIGLLFLAIGIRAINKDLKYIVMTADEIQVQEEIRKSRQVPHSAYEQEE